MDHHPHCLELVKDREMSSGTFAHTMNSMFFKQDIRIISRKLGGLGYTTGDVDEVLAITGVNCNLLVYSAKQCCGEVLFMIYSPPLASFMLYSQLSWAQMRQNAAFLPGMIYYDFRISVNQHGLMMSRSSTDDVKMQGTRLCFFILNVVEFSGVLMTLKPFLARKQYRQKHGTNWFSNVIRLNMVFFRHGIDIRKRVIAFTIRVYWDRIHQQSMIRFLKSERRQLLM